MTEELENRENNWLSCLDDGGYRLTRPRRAVVKTLAESEQALSPTQIFDLGREKYPSLGLVSVYRTLEILDDLGLIQRVHHPEGCQTYIAAFEGHQHLLICKQCGKTAFFDGDNLNALITRVENQSGFQITEHWLQLFGLCESCKNKN
ncbi:MAG: Fur family transcriptional regulator [Chloroflexota bacterium]